MHRKFDSTKRKCALRNYAKGIYVCMYVYGMKIFYVIDACVKIEMFRFQIRSVDSLKSLGGDLPRRGSRAGDDEDGIDGIPHRLIFNLKTYISIFMAKYTMNSYSFVWMYDLHT